MRLRAASLLLTICAMAQCSLLAQTPAAPAKASPARDYKISDANQYSVTFVKLGREDKEGLIYEPRGGGNAPSPVGLVLTYPRTQFGQSVIADELARRGYRVLMVMPYTEHELPFDGVPETSAGVSYLRSLPGIDKVVVIGHSAGGRLMAFYADAALNGPAICRDPALLLPCKPEQATDLAKPDGVILLDPAPGALNLADTVDPAWDGKGRGKRDLDLYAPENGYDANSGTATYSETFKTRFFAAQSARNMALIDGALEQERMIAQGKGDYADNEPLVLPATVNNGAGAALFHADLSLMSHTKRPIMVLKSDGTQSMEIARSIRPADAAKIERSIGSLSGSAMNFTVRHFLAKDALRTNPDFRMTEDDVTGVDWRSSLSSTPGSAEGITVPTLILTMTCFQLVVTSEIAYDHLAAKDKTIAAVEGAIHEFTPCKPEYGDTKRRTFDFVASWLAKPGRFVP